MSYFYLYVILDILSRYAVGWMVADRENSALGGRLIQQTCLKYGVQPEHGGISMLTPRAGPLRPGRRCHRTQAGRAPRGLGLPPGTLRLRTAHHPAHP